MPIWKLFGAPKWPRNGTCKQSAMEWIDQSILECIWEPFCPPLGSYLAPFELRLGLIGPHLGHTWASLGPICPAFRPHWAHAMPASRTPQSGPFELHLCPRGPFELHLSSISDPCWLHLDQICIPLDTDRQTRSHTDRPTSNSGSGLAECAQRFHKSKSS